MRVLGVVINSRLTMKDHLHHLLSSCASYDRIMLRTHALRDKQIHVVATITRLTSMLYASPVCWGVANASNWDRIDRLMWRFNHVHILHIENYIRMHKNK